MSQAICPASETAAPREPETRGEGLDLSSLLESHALSAHFQPIVNLREARLHGYEALIRGPRGTALAMPDALFDAALRSGLLLTLEFECVRASLQTWVERRMSGKLFVNLSADALTSAVGGNRLESGLELLRQAGVPVSALVLELTEHERVGELEALRQATELLRLQGVQIALDDFGDGRSSLRLWSELRPDYVKIDKYFTRGVADDANKLQTYRAMMQIAETFGAELVAEGIETAADLRVVRDLGVRFGQGWQLGYPQAEPLGELTREVLEVLRGRDIAVLPELRRAAHRRVTAAQLLQHAPVVAPSATHDELYRVISNDAELRAIAVVEDGRPLALIDCQQFINHYARPFFREVYGRRNCMLHANPEPLIVELHTGMEYLTSVLIASDQRYLREGFIITENGLYRGVGTGAALVKAVTEARIDAARHANPLTFLPGNIPIAEHIERLLQSGGDFAAGYADLNRFKPYNDHYGYWRGDEMIRLAARVISKHVDRERDFVGHIGGDDFIIVFQSPDWRERCERMVAEFNTRALEMFDPEARAAGGIYSEDRQGEMRFHSFTTLSVGVACVAGGTYPSAEEVSAAAAMAKRLAKQETQGCYVLRGRAAA